MPHDCPSKGCNNKIGTGGLLDRCEVCKKKYAERRDPIDAIVKDGTKELGEMMAKTNEKRKQGEEKEHLCEDCKVDISHKGANARRCDICLAAQKKKYATDHYAKNADKIAKARKDKITKEKKERSKPIILSEETKEFLKKKEIEVKAREERKKLGTTDDNPDSERYKPEDDMNNNTDEVIIAQEDVDEAKSLLEKIPVDPRTEEELLRDEEKELNPEILIDEAKSWEELNGDIFAELKIQGITPQEVVEEMKKYTWDEDKKKPKKPDPDVYMDLIRYRKNLEGMTPRAEMEKAIKRVENIEKELKLLELDRAFQVEKRKEELTNLAFEFDDFILDEMTSGFSKKSSKEFRQKILDLR